MRIALISRDTSSTEGVSRYVSALGKALANRHEVTVFSPGATVLDGTNVKHVRLRVIGRSGIIFHLTLLISTILSLLVRRILTNEKFDFVHSHHYGIPTGDAVKIALVTPEVHSYGGVPQYVSALAKALATEHEVTIFSVLFNNLENTGIHHRRVWALGSGGFIRSITFALASSLLLLLWYLKKAQRFDIVHSHGDYAALANIASSHYCEAVESERLRRQKRNATLGERLRRRSMALLEKYAVNRNKGKPLIVLSEQMKRDFAHHYGVPYDKVFVIPGGVDSKIYSPSNVSLHFEEIRRRHFLDLNTPVVLFVGGDWERKGLPQAIKAISCLDTLKPNLLVVGHGDISLFKQMASDVGVERQVVFVGQSRETWKYFAACDVFLLPTLYEAFGLVILEAMASGLPVLVSETAGAAELIQDGLNGLILKDPRDVSEIAAKLEGLLLNDCYSKQLGEEARRTALAFSWERAAQRTVEVYRDILG